MQDQAGNPLTEYVPKAEYFIGIDSDGCAFDAMEIKHKECFIPNTIKHWKLQAASSLVRETAEFVNLYSVGRGLNRWPSLIKVFDLLAKRPEVLERGVKVPTGDIIKAFVASDYPLSPAGMRQYAADHPGDPEADMALAWSAGVDASIADMVHGVPPFPGVMEALQAGHKVADQMVVSATPIDALEREWNEHGLAAHMDVIAGQEYGTKLDHLKQAAVGRYPLDKILLIGDSLGDLATAQAAGVLFYPINPQREAESWRRYCEEGLARFIDGTFAGEYQDALIAEFESLLPSEPSWPQITSEGEEK